MGKLEYRGEEGEGLKAIKDMVKDAVKIFAEALPGMDEHMSFKAFTLPVRENVDEMKMMVDVLMTALAIEIKEQLNEKLEEIGFGSSVEKDDCGDVKIWLHAKKGAYPIEKEETPVVELKED